MKRSELPIFSDNLRSSASWADLLAVEQKSWKEALSTPDARRETESRIRDIQAKQTLLRTSQKFDEDRLSAAAGLISAWAGETEARLTVERLLEVHGALMGAQPGEDLLRKTEPLPINERHDPTPARLLPRMLDNAFDWFATPGFNELHPVEQSTVVYLRLLDLHPFPQLTEATALLAAGFYTERAGLPPLIIFADGDTQERYSSAIDAAFRMLTQPLVEFFAEMLRRAMRLGAGAEDEK
ncbi:MAG: Fic family protein [Blastocatellia bacterium]|nr:Fic family protein [Blastocatellia bacterium]